MGGVFERERPVDLVAKNAPLGPCGLWVAMPGRDVVFFESGTSKVHREHIILHELAHLLCSHRSTERLDAGILRELFPTCGWTWSSRSWAAAGTPRPRSRRPK